jgi:hypothetical protein
MLEAGSCLLEGGLAKASDRIALHVSESLLANSKVPELDPLWKL